LDVIDQEVHEDHEHEEHLERPDEPDDPLGEWSGALAVDWGDKVAYGISECFNEQRHALHCQQVGFIRIEIIAARAGAHHLFLLSLIILISAPEFNIDHFKKDRKDDDYDHHEQHEEPYILDGLHQLLPQLIQRSIEPGITHDFVS